jgi:hypothetical protein
MINKFQNNKYTRMYFSIIEKAKNREIPTTIERHHVLPKSMGGTNAADNLIELTPKEHFICHRLLPKMCVERTDYRKMRQAEYIMSNMQKKRGVVNFSITSRWYQKLRIEHCERSRNRMKGFSKPWQDKINKNPIKISRMAERHRGMKRSQTAREYMSKVAKETGRSKGPKNHQFTGYFVTPLGVFEDTKVAAEALGLHFNTVCERCKRKNNKIITRPNPKDRRWTTPESIGKTWADLGWGITQNAPK